MKVNLNTILKTYEGKPFRVKPNGEEERDVTAKDVVLPLILSPGKASNWEDHLIRDDLARKIYLAKEECEVSSEEIVLMKGMMGQSNFSPAAVAQVIRILEGKADV